MARQVMDQLKSDGKVSRSKLGVTIQNVTADIAASPQTNYEMKAE
jgi:S1-C subfamily serine protease